MRRDGLSSSQCRHRRVAADFGGVRNSDFGGVRNSDFGGGRNFCGTL